MDISNEGYVFIVQVHINGVPSRARLLFTDFNELLRYVQFIEADLRQRLEHAKEVTEEAKGTLKAFTAQSTQVGTFIRDATTWLAKLEESLMSGAQTATCEGLKKVKVGNILLWFTLLWE